LGSSIPLVTIGKISTYREAALPLFGRLFPGKRTTYLFQIFWIILIQIIEKSCLKKSGKISKNQEKTKRGE
jgi:hypothetical protein